MSRQDIIHQNAQIFNEDCVAFDIDMQNQEQEKEDTTDTVIHDNTRNTTDTLCMLYAKAAKRQDINFQDYCRHVHNLNTDHCHIVMYNRPWCKSYINTI